MAPIKVIGASLGDCGTDNLKVALDILGYKTHNMKCFFEDPSLSCDEFYAAYLNREEADWDELYKNFDAVVDWTASTFYKDLLAKYPDAKVILPVRSVDSWYISVKKTRALIDSTPNHSFQRFSTAVCLDGWIQNPEKFVQEKKVKQMYLDHIAQVKQIVPVEQLLILNIGDGWGKLCTFLDKEVPNVSYPSANPAVEFENHFVYSERHNIIPTIRITTV